MIQALQPYTPSTSERSHTIPNFTLFSNSVTYLYLCLPVKSPTQFLLRIVYFFTRLFLANVCILSVTFLKAKDWLNLLTKLVYRGKNCSVLEVNTKPR